jgi:hypothetical protein
MKERTLVAVVGTCKMEHVLLAGTVVSCHTWKHYKDLNAMRLTIVVTFNSTVDCVSQGNGDHWTRRPLLNKNNNNNKSNQWEAIVGHRGPLSITNKRTLLPFFFCKLNLWDWSIAWSFDHAHQPAWIPGVVAVSRFVGLREKNRVSFVLLHAKNSSCGLKSPL